MNQKFCNILVVRVSLRDVYNVTDTVEGVVGSIVVVGALTLCALLQSVSDLKARQMNVKGGLIWELIL